MASPRLGVLVALVSVCLFATGASAVECKPECVNGGVCTQSEDNIKFCRCPAGFWGERCAAQYTTCKKGLVCYNGGQCVRDPAKPDQETCACAKGWTGATCKVPHRHCGNSTLACMNGGDCVLDEALSEWFCACPPNLRGRQCQLGVMECAQGMFCMNNGQCSSDGLKCECPAGFFGIHCQNDERDAFADRIPRKKLPGWGVALVVFASLVAVAGVAGVVFLVRRERRGSPYFKSWQDNAAGLTSGL